MRTTFNGAAEPRASGSSCHGAADTEEPPPSTVAAGHIRVALVGAPNVGKSALFNRLTRRYVTVSNYPGTTVEVSRGRTGGDDLSAEVIDTPGIYSLLPATEEEHAARRLLFAGDLDVVVHVVDAKNLPRMLPLTVELSELGLPMVVALNMVDEAERLGLSVDERLLASRMGAEVVPVVAVEGRGVPELRLAITRAAGRTASVLTYGDGVGTAIRSVLAALSGAYPVDRAAIASLLLQGDAEVAAAVRHAEPDGGHRALTLAGEGSAELGAPAYRLAVERRRAAEQLLDGLARGDGTGETGWTSRLGRLLSRPATGIPLLLLVLYVGLYQFVGLFGGGTVVDWMENTVFTQRLNPFFERLFAGVPWPEARSLFVGEYGILTLGLRYAVAIILPIVGAFFLFFSILEDCGYFPRLAMLLDRVFKRLGLSGRAVIPIVLGFACDTMATMVTRTLESRRERVLATLLLALAVPCSAQLGVILAILSGHPLALGVWAVSVLGTFLLVGAIGARVLPGEPALFHMEIPPLRLPRPENVLSKTAARMQWYFLEVLPLFLLVSVLLWAGELTGLFRHVLAVLSPVVQALGLPVDAARVFLFGFFRRDYGAAGLYDIQAILDPVQLAVAGVTLTLFVPCVAQFLMMVRERGIRTALGMLAFITPFAFGAGFVVNVVLRALL